MAEATYDLTQTGQQVQAILNDANKVMGAGSVTSMTTDSIILKGTDGSYHKIDKSSFTEAVRNTLASLLVNNDKGTTISQIAAIYNNDFGSITVANLASILGTNKNFVSPPSGGGIVNIQLGRARSWIMIAWVNSALAVSPAIIGAGRNGEVTLLAGIGNITLSDNANSFCVYKAQNTDNYITVKNNTTYSLSLSYYLILLDL